jgi:hypothetical protein
MSRILLASILKPVNDARNYEKTGISMARAGYKVGIAGRNLSTFESPAENTEFLPWFDFPRHHPRRWLSAWIFIRNALRWNPQLLVLGTWELLLPSLVLKLLRPSLKVVYDVQENYFRNLWYSRVYPPVLRHALAVAVRALEYASQLWIKEYWLAERCYAAEISFLETCMVLENKCKRPAQKNAPPTDGPVTYLYSGTIAQNYGTEKAIEWFLAQAAQNPALRLAIVGYAPQHAYYQALKARYGAHASLHWEGGDVLVPHTRIVAWMQQAHAGIISYVPDPSTEQCIPTKLYEYAGYGLPIVLLSENKTWQRLIEEMQKNPEAEAWYWESQEVDLLHRVRKLLAGHSNPSLEV